MCGTCSGLVQCIHRETCHRSDLIDYKFLTLQQLKTFFKKANSGSKCQLICSKNKRELFQRKLHYKVRQRVRYLNEVYLRLQFKKSLRLHTSFLMCYWKNIRAFPVYDIYFKEIVLDKSVGKIDNDFQRGFVKHWLNSAWITGPRNLLTISLFLNSQRTFIIWRWILW